MPTHWTGRKHSPETREKMRLAKLGKKNNFYGKAHSSETREAISQSRRGKVAVSRGPQTEETKRRIGDTRVLRGSAVGDLNPNWHGGISEQTKTERQRAMSTSKYVRWRKRYWNEITTPARSVVNVVSRTGKACLTTRT